jgi:hypothetical protein
LVSFIYPLDPAPIEIYSNLTHHTFTSVSINIYLFKLIFEDIKSSGHGGALSFYHNKGYNKVLIEETNFVQCSTIGTGNGGSIYFYQFGNLSMNRVLGSYCHTSYEVLNYGQFIYFLQKMMFPIFHFFYQQSFFLIIFNMVLLPWYLNMEVICY